LAGLIEPMLSSARAYPLALCTDRNESSDDRPPDALKIPARQGGIYTLRRTSLLHFRLSQHISDVTLLELAMLARKKHIPLGLSLGSFLIGG
jgi:hypothetical protein